MLGIFIPIPLWLAYAMYISHDENKFWNIKICLTCIFDAKTWACFHEFLLCLKCRKNGLYCPDLSPIPLLYSTMHPVPFFDCSARWCDFSLLPEMHCSIFLHGKWSSGHWDSVLYMICWTVLLICLLVFICSKNCIFVSCYIYELCLCGIFSAYSINTLNIV